jgi:hypothetical protein
MLRIRGNTAALARLVIVLCCLLIASWLAYLFRAEPSVVVGSFLGAGVSLIVNWFVGQLEDPETEKVPPEFLVAAKRDIRWVGYYRRDQKINISVQVDETRKSTLIVLVFTATIVPVGSGPAKVRYPTILAPKGLERVKDKEFYKVGDNQVYEGMDINVRDATQDELTVTYKLIETARGSFQDRHLWPSPVLSYSIIVDRSGGYSYQVGRIVAGGQSEVLASKSNGQNLVFLGDGPAFTTQGVEWRISGEFAHPASVPK